MTQTAEQGELHIFEAGPRLIDTIDTAASYAHGIEATIIERDIAYHSHAQEHSLAQAAFDLEKLYSQASVTLFEPTHE